jgi:hypothetical protein
MAGPQAVGGHVSPSFDETSSVDDDRALPFPPPAQAQHAHGPHGGGSNGSGHHGNVGSAVGAGGGPESFYYGDAAYALDHQPGFVHLRPALQSVGPSDVLGGGLPFTLPDSLPLHASSMHSVELALDHAADGFPQGAFTRLPYTDHGDGVALGDVALPPPLRTGQTDPTGGAASYIVAGGACCLSAPVLREMPVRSCTYRWA